MNGTFKKSASGEVTKLAPFTPTLIDNGEGVLFGSNQESKASGVELFRVVRVDLPANGPNPGGGGGAAGGAVGVAAAATAEVADDAAIQPDSNAGATCTTPTDDVSKGDVRGEPEQETEPEPMEAHVLATAAAADTTSPVNRSKPASRQATPKMRAASPQQRQQQISNGMRPAIKRVAGSGTAGQEVRKSQSPTASGSKKRTSTPSSAAADNSKDDGKGGGTGTGTSNINSCPRQTARTAGKGVGASPGSGSRPNSSTAVAASTTVRALIRAASTTTMITTMIGSPIDGGGANSGTGGGGASGSPVDSGDASGGTSGAGGASGGQRLVAVGGGAPAGSNDDGVDDDSSDDDNAGNFKTPISIRETKRGAGKGLFVDVASPYGTVLGRYPGKVITMSVRDTCVGVWVLWWLIIEDTGGNATLYLPSP